MILVLLDHGGESLDSLGSSSDTTSLGRRRGDIYICSQVGVEAQAPQVVSIGTIIDVPIIFLLYYCPVWMKVLDPY